MLVTTSKSSRSVHTTTGTVRLTRRGPSSRVAMICTISNRASGRSVLRRFSGDVISRIEGGHLRPVRGLLGRGNVSCRVGVLRKRPKPTVIRFSGGVSFSITMINDQNLGALRRVILKDIDRGVTGHIGTPILVIGWDSSVCFSLS